MAVPTLPKNLQNPLDLAIAIYTRWRKNIINKSGAKTTGWPEWDDMDYDQRISLVDAVNVQVIAVAKDYKTEVEVELAWGDTPLPDPNPTPLMNPPPQQEQENTGALVQYPCYVCAAAATGSPGGTCPGCSLFIKRLLKP